MGKSSSQLTDQRRPYSPRNDCAWVFLPCLVISVNGLSEASLEHKCSSFVSKHRSWGACQWHFSSWRPEGFILKTTTKAHSLYWIPKEVHTKIGLKQYLLEHFKVKPRIYASNFLHTRRMVMPFPAAWCAWWGTVQENVLFLPCCVWDASQSPVNIAEQAQGSDGTGLAAALWKTVFMK